MKISDALERFLVQLEADGRSPHTIGQYRRHIKLLDRWLESERLSRDVRRINHETIARFLCSPLARHRPDGKGKKPTSTNALRTSLRCFFSYLHRAGTIRIDPARLVRRAICSPPPPRALSEDEQTRLLRVLAEAEGEKARRDHAMFHLMLATGVRVGSAVALDVEDVDLDAGEMWLRSTKGNRPDRILLGRKIRQHLRRWIHDRPSGPLFPGACDRRLSTRHVARRLDVWLKQAGIERPATPHSLRHSFASSLYHRSGDIVLVKTALLHKSIQSTLIYTELCSPQIRRALQS